ncbi:hypothetical protein MMRN_p0030 (plasmid) [Mycobacterium marinum]|nr:hypothetical protein MMRN_p0030 [Mycobacterium marinum]
MPTPALPPTGTDSASAWRALAHLIAARPTVRVWNPATNKFDSTKSLTARLPHLPAAVLLYLRGRTQVLALDFDTKRHSQHTVDTDFTRALTWITECGGVAVTDQSRSGGRHILVPLAIGTTATATELAPLMRLLEARLPSLDKTPMMNPKTGCITVPGSPCREGGHRILDGPLISAVEAFTRRSDPALLPRLNVLLGALRPTNPAARATGLARPLAESHTALTGDGHNTRLRAQYVRTSDLPERITAYATTGKLPTDTTWRSHSEARQSVLAHAVLHGHSLATIRALIAPRQTLAYRASRRIRPLSPPLPGRTRTRLRQSPRMGRCEQPQIPTYPRTRSSTHTGGRSGAGRTPALARQRHGLGRTRIRWTRLQVDRAGDLPSAGGPCDPCG